MAAIEHSGLDVLSEQQCSFELTKTGRESGGELEAANYQVLKVESGIDDTKHLGQLEWRVPKPQ